MAEPMVEPLLRELRDVVDRADPIPGHVLAAAKAAFLWRTIDAELAELVNDSSVAGAAVRATDAARLLTFEGPGLEVEVEIAETGPTRRLTGQLVPASLARVTVRWTGGSADVDADEVGRFTAEGVPATSVRLEVYRSDDSRPIVTSWVSI
jgi:hypothetical protein